MLSEQLKAKVRHHLGYLQVQQASTFVLGVPAGVQTQFVIEGAFAKILPGAEQEVTVLVERLDAIECQIVDDTPNVAVDTIDEIKLREDEFEQLVKRYRYWQGALCNLLGVSANPFDQRPALGMGWSGGGSGINSPVTG